ncbi:MAG: FAD-dependent oxidoreductase [Treponema sp.]|jgi:NADPH-dependent 2,4-dienoyl-CoA reductase/sulfur reductase-like enzyme/rhodanese-related sulfurtransferase|nr:FAD-dependent oxidoreductase [Treponema sp.]
MAKIVIVGGVAGGASAAARLRRLDERAEIILFERGEYISFANCGLPYYIGGTITDKDELLLQTPESFYERFRVDVRVSQEVLSINRSSRNVVVKNLGTGETYTESYDTLILAPGAEPMVPQIEGIHSDKIFTLRSLRDALRIKEYIAAAGPASAVVVGGGSIGVEITENLRDAGLEVFLVEMFNQIVPPVDYEMICAVHRHIRQKGVRLILNNKVKSLAEEGGALRVFLDEGELRSDMLIMAAGVRPEGGLAGAAGLALNERGCIIVGPDMRTSDPAIYALGDAAEVTGFVSGKKEFSPLAGPANKQGRIVADNICGLNALYAGTQGSAILKIFDMTVAMTGMNERTAKKLAYDYDKSYTYSPSHAGYYPGAENMAIKIIYQKKDGRLLGAQVVGFDGVDKRCDVLAVAIRAGMTIFDLTRLELCYAPPYSSARDPVNIAGFAAENIMTGKVRVFHWHDVDALPKDGSATLLDVRTAEEYARGTIPGFMNMPLDHIRDRIKELDTGKPVYVICRIGLRGYIAARILSQNGFEVYNLSGGFALYNSVFGSTA